MSQSMDFEYFKECVLEAFRSDTSWEPGEAMPLRIFALTFSADEMLDVVINSDVLVNEDMGYYFRTQALPKILSDLDAHTACIVKPDMMCEPAFLGLPPEDPAWDTHDHVSVVKFTFFDIRQTGCLYVRTEQGEYGETLLTDDEIDDDFDMSDLWNVTLVQGVTKNIAARN